MHSCLPIRAQPETMRFTQSVLSPPLNNHHHNVSNHNNNHEADTADNGNPLLYTHNNLSRRSQSIQQAAAVAATTLSPADAHLYAYGNLTDADPAVCISSGGAVSFTKNAGHSGGHLNASAASVLVDERDPDGSCFALRYRPSAASTNGNADELHNEDSRNVNLQQVRANEFTIHVSANKGEIYYIFGMYPGRIRTAEHCCGAEQQWRF